MGNLHNNNNKLLSGKRDKASIENEINLQQALSMIMSKWHVFAISFAVAFLAAFLFNKFTPPVYKVTATLLIDEDKKNISSEDSRVLRGFGLQEGSSNLDNQIMILRSRMLINRTLDEMDYDIEYYYKSLFKKITLFPDSPIQLLPEDVDSIPSDIEFGLKLTGNNMFSLKSSHNDSAKFETLTAFRSFIKAYGKSFRIAKNEDFLKDNEDLKKIYFINHDRQKLTDYFSERLRIDPVSEDGTMLSISLESSNRAKDIEFLNKLIEIFLDNSLDKKNEEAVRVINFIDDQLIGISDSLVIAENKLQQFRSTHRVMDLSAQGRAIIEQAMNLENEKARIDIEANYYSYLADYLSKDKAGEVPMAPATIGIVDPGLTKLVADLADLQGQLYSKSLGERNPLQSQLTQRIRTTKDALRETLSGVMRANNLARDEIAAQIRTVNAQATALPVTERQLLGIERKFKLNDELYTFLLEKRAEAQIQKASNMPDNELIDKPEAGVRPVKPKKPLIYLLAFVLSIGFTLLWIIISQSLNNKINTESDIKDITDVPVSGQIPHSSERKAKVVFEAPGSFTAEAFRSLRSRMQFMTKNADSPIILVTSTMKEEGKTFTAINLASAYSLTGKRTVIVDFDLRRPTMHDQFALSNLHGVSTWLIGKAGLREIIQSTEFDNLSVITSGPVPPNPSELMAMERTQEFLSNLRQDFDCIIIDTSPVGIISDAFHLISLADTSVMVVRQKMTIKEMLENTLKDFDFSEIKSMSIVVNDLRPDYGKFRYDGKYRDYHYK